MLTSRFAEVGEHPSATTQLVCLSPNGLSPHPTDCAKFLNCWNGHAHVQDCGPGTLFNPKISVCDWPYRVSCKESSASAPILSPRWHSSASSLHPIKSGKNVKSYTFTFKVVT